MFVISRLPAPRHAGACRRALSLVAGVCLMSASAVQAQSSPPPKPPQLPPGVQGKGKLVPAKVPDSVMATMPRTIKMPTTDAGFFEQRDERAAHRSQSTGTTLPLFGLIRIWREKNFKFKMSVMSSKSAEKVAHRHLLDVNCKLKFSSNRWRRRRSLSKFKRKMSITRS